MKRWLFIVMICSAVAPARLLADPSQTVVIANQRVPESVALAHYYLAARGIPTNHLCILDLPAGETITRTFYDERLRDPLLAFLRERNLIDQVKRTPKEVKPFESSWRTVASRVRYVVSMYGVPLRIAGSKPFPLDQISRLVDEPFSRDSAAVDSELALALWEAYPIRGYIANPHYNMLFINRAERQTRPVLIAARIDGPDADAARRMIDDALHAERHGLHGRAYVDTRGLNEGEYMLGDHWLREAGERLRRTGYDVIYDRTAALFSDTFPMEDAAFYLGWYTSDVQGPFRQPDFSFRRGAVAYHLHSGSAKSLRTTDRYWAGPLVAAGAAAVMGAVDEPYLAYTPDLQVFVERMVSGHTFGESAMLSMRALSWQITVIGDPLYRPFARRVAPPDGESSPKPPEEIAWEHLRRMNLLTDQQQFNIALRFAREVLGQQDSLIIREKIADLYAKNELWTDAIPEYRRIVEHAQTDLTAIRVGHRLVLILRLLKQTEEADALVRKIRTAWPDSPYLPYLDTAQP